MEARELRIGNYYAIALEQGIVYPQVKELTVNQFGNYSSNGHNLELAAQPIPLTEEWLLRFGFEKRNGHYFKGKWRIDFAFRKPANFILQTPKGALFICHVQYVHQLQNLYFALTGE